VNRSARRTRPRKTVALSDTDLIERGVHDRFEGLRECRAQYLAGLNRARQGRGVEGRRARQFVARGQAIGEGLSLAAPERVSPRRQEDAGEAVALA